MGKAQQSNNERITSFITANGTSTRIIRTGNKEGGANKSGADGGIYQFLDEDNNPLLALDKNGKSIDAIDRDGNITTEKVKRRMLVKSDVAAKDMAEYLVGKIFEVTAPDNSARIHLLTINNQTYIGSEFLPNYEDLNKQVNSKFALHKDGRVIAAGSTSLLTGFMRVKMLGPDGKPKYQGFPQTMATSLLVGDFDVHTGNVGLIRNPGNQKNQLVRIDYAAAFEKLENQVHPHSISRHPFGRGPTNHFKEYPRSMRISPEFAEHCFEVASKNIVSKIDTGIDELKKYYKPEDFMKFAERLGINKQKMSFIKPEIMADYLKGHLSNLMLERQKSLKEFALEISVDLCFDAKGKYKSFNRENGDVIDGKDHLNNLVKNNFEYFKDIAEGKKPLHFRDNSHKSLFGFLNWTGLTPGAKLKAAVRNEIGALVKSELNSRSINNLLNSNSNTAPKISSDRDSHKIESVVKATAILRKKSWQEKIKTERLISPDKANRL